MHGMRFLLFSTVLCLTTATIIAQKSTSPQGSYLVPLDDASLDVGLKVVSVFALDDRAPLSSNPHFQAMWNLIQLGAKLESLLNGTGESLNDIDLSREFGQNGFNRSVVTIFARYGFGESVDVSLQNHFFELAISPGYFKEGNGGFHIHLDYQANIMKTNYGAGVNSIGRAFDYEVYVGARIGFDGSSGRSESEAGFFTHLKDEIKRIANENEFTAAQLIMLEELVDDSKILLPEDVGGRAFHLGPIIGGRLSKRILGNARVFIEGMGFYDIMDLNAKNEERENKRSQHHLSIIGGLSFAIGGQGQASGGGLIDFF